MVEIFRKVLPKEPVRPRAPIDDPAQLTRVEDALFQAHRLNDELKPMEAVAMFRRALAIDPLSETAVAELGATLVDAGHSDEGLATFVTFLEAHPNAVDVRLAHAGSLLRTGALRAAVDACRICLEQRPNWEAPFPPLIRALHRLDQRAAALQALEGFRPVAKDARIVAMLETMLEKAR